MKNQYKLPKVAWVSLLATLAFIGVTSCEDEDFRVIPEEDTTSQIVTALEPSLSDIGTTITIIGANFNRVPANNRVSFNGVPTLVTTATDTTLTVTVPEDATTGPVTVAKGSISVDGPVFTVVDIPTISDVDPEIAADGDTVTITGTKYSITANDNTVLINGIEATVIEATATTIITTVPSGSAAGIGDISVTVGGQTGTFPGFTITPAIITLNPLIGEEGTVVTITGTSFSTAPEDNMVSFNGTAAVVMASTATSITTSIPVGATSGAVSITVNGQTAESPDFTVGAPTVTLNIPINTAEDDVEEAADGRVRATDSDFEIAEWNTAFTPDFGEQKIGLRFNNVAIPTNVTILSARIQFTVDATGSDPAEMTLYGENVGNAVIYEETDNNLSNRPLTTASAVWDIAPWENTGDRLDAQKTADLSAIIQEIIDRGDWASGNGLNIIMIPSGVSTGLTDADTTVGRESETFDGGAADAPELIIIFQE